jgi:ABC-type uncharacterized transport system permease subunit
MDRLFLLTATLLATFGAVWGMLAVKHGKRSRITVIWMAAAFLCQVGFLLLRGQQRAACPLVGTGEILAFLAWSLTLFYLLIGPAYRISLLGVFSAPLIVLFQLIALLPGKLDPLPQRVSGSNPWYETHSALSVLAYGALALAAIAGVMFLVLDRQLKGQQLKSGLFKNLPPVHELQISLQRLLWLGTGLLTGGIAAGFLMPHTTHALAHFIAAIVVWLSYIGLIAMKAVRGMTGKRLAISAVVFFALSLLVFAFV